MATFRKRGKKWSYRIDMGRDPITKDRIQTTVSFNDDFPGGFFKKEDCVSSATKHQYELDHGTYVRNKEIMFTEFAKEWFKDYSRNTKVSTIRVRKYQLLYFTKQFVNDKLKDINEKKYQAFLDHLHIKGIKKKSVAGPDERGLKENTISGIHTTGSLLFEYAIKHKYLKEDPTTYATLPKKLRTVEEIENKVEVPKYLEKEELAHFLKIAKTRGKPADYFIFLTLAYSGMRDGELCVLKKSDFDKETKEISISKTYFSEYGRIAEYVLITPKTKGSIRKVEVDQVVFDALEEHLATQNEIKMRYRKTYHDKGFAFANEYEYPGYPINIAYINARMQRILKLSKLNPKLTPHSLRHTHTSLCAEAGVSLEDIQNRLGHQDDDTTKLVYMHVTKKRKKDAAQKFSELMKNL